MRASCSCLSPKRKYDWSFGRIASGEQAVAAGVRVLLDARVMPGGDGVSAHLARGVNKLRKLDFGVAQAAGDGRFARQVAFHKGAHHALLKAVFQVDHVVGKSQKAGHAASVIHVVERAAAPAGASGLTFLGAQKRGQAPLVPELHGHADHGRRAVGIGVRIVFSQQRRGHGTVHAAAHGDCNGHGNQSSAFSQRLCLCPWGLGADGFLLVMRRERAKLVHHARQHLKSVIDVFRSGEMPQAESNGRARLLILSADGGEHV